jgi:hypothetical protein
MRILGIPARPSCTGWFAGVRALVGRSAGLLRRVRLRASPRLPCHGARETTHRRPPREGEGLSEIAREVGLVAPEAQRRSRPSLESGGPPGAENGPLGVARRRRRRLADGPGVSGPRRIARRAKRGHSTIGSTALEAPGGLAEPGAGPERSRLTLPESGGDGLTRSVTPRVRATRSGEGLDRSRKPMLLG